MRYEEQTFDLPDLQGITDKQVDVHLKLYAGYVKHVNHILEKLEALQRDPEKNGYELAELRRRFGFEFDGMRNHEIYFEDISGGSAELPGDSQLATAIEQTFGSFDEWMTHFKGVAGGTRGNGWTFLAYDKKAEMLHNIWVSDHEVGQLTDTRPVLALDMWEHAYMVDYLPAEKKAYIDAYLENVNWKHVAERFATAL